MKYGDTRFPSDKDDIRMFFWRICKREKGERSQRYGEQIRLPWKGIINCLQCVHLSKMWAHLMWMETVRQGGVGGNVEGLDEVKENEGSRRMGSLSIWVWRSDGRILLLVVWRQELHCQGLRSHLHMAALTACTTDRRS